MSTFVVAGASGFIGRHIVERLVQTDHRVIALGRELTRLAQGFPPRSNLVLVGYEKLTDYRPDIMETIAKIHEDVDIVINAAGVAHGSSATEADYLCGITDFTRELATASALRNGVRFINISSIAARSPGQSARKKLRWYGEAKRKAELDLDRISAQYALPAVSLRPPAVWGPSAPGAFSVIRRCVTRGIPLPVGAVTTRRSYIHVSSLVDHILHLAELTGLPQFPRSHIVLEVSDGQYTLPEIILKVAKELSVDARVFWFPPFALRFAIMAVGNKTLLEATGSDMLVDATAVTTLEKKLLNTP